MPVRKTLGEISRGLHVYNVICRYLSNETRNKNLNECNSIEYCIRSIITGVTERGQDEICNSSQSFFVVFRLIIAHGRAGRSYYAYRRARACVCVCILWGGPLDYTASKYLIIVKRKKKKKKALLAFNSTRNCSKEYKKERNKKKNIVILPPLERTFWVMWVCIKQHTHTHTVKPRRNSLSFTSTFFFFHATSFSSSAYAVDRSYIVDATHSPPHPVR